METGYGRICITRGSINSMNSFIAELPNQDAELGRESFPLKDEFPCKPSLPSRMSEEFFNLDISRPSGRLSRNTQNWVLKLPQGKNSDQILQRLGEPFVESPNDSHEILKVRISTEQSNPNRSLEIVMEWPDQDLNPVDLQEMINRLSIQEEQGANYKPDRLSIVPQKQQNQGCICKKTKCLKLYCQCFQAMKMCTEACECIDCCNGDENEERSKAIQQAQGKNPETFNKDEDDPIIEVKKQSKGCNCKKSKCLKKYCECYNAQMVCGPHCNCQDCCNIEILKEDLLHHDEDQFQLDRELSFDQVPHKPIKRFKQ